ncbi:RNA methyltransferase [soil metagenome]
MEVRDLFLAPSAPRGEEIRRAAQDSGAPLLEVSDGVLRAVADTATPQGAVAVVGTPRVTVRELPEDISLVLVLSEVRDPGNAGTLLRTAVAAGADAVVFAGKTVDPFSPKAVRASAGAVWRVPVITAPQPRAVLIALRDRGQVTLATSADGPPADAADLTRPLALVLGNEAWGIEPSLADLVDEQVGIAMPGPVESLNVAIAGSILLFEAARQRRTR